MDKGETVFIALYWIACTGYWLLVWLVPKFLGHVPGIPDLRMKAVKPELRWIAPTVHLAVSFMPFANLIATVRLLYSVIKAVLKHRDDLPG